MQQDEDDQEQRGNQVYDDDSDVQHPGMIPAQAPAASVPSMSRIARSSSGKWHAATWPGWWGSSSGSSSLQMGNWARGQRGWNRHPDGGLIGEGTSPSRMIRFFWAARSGS